jgi:hypothetical protein
MNLNINTDAVVGMTNKLEKLHKSALPSAVRGSLNNAAYDLKTNTMPSKADATFVKRSDNFFKANSKYEYATGFKVDAMVARVGFIENKLKGGDNYSVKDLEQQENGGSINNRAFVPLEGARKDNSMTGLVKPNMRLKRIKTIINPINAKAKNVKEAFIKSVMFAGKGGFVLGELGGNGILWGVNSTSRTEDGKFKLTALYSFKAGRQAKVKGTGFMRSASLESAKKMEKYYIEEAKRQIHKLEGGHH